MSLDSAGLGDVDSSLADIAYLTRSEHRAPMLVALATHPRTRDELCELTDVSSSTAWRTLDGFEERNWIVKRGHHYEATEFGVAVATGIEALLQQIETGHKLRDVWDSLPAAVCEFTLDAPVDTRVTTADAADPYAPVNRFRTILRDATTFRFVGSEVALFEPC